ncbi:MAG: hypothetical protein ACLP7P_16940 [Rhodomicrobium sp.]
MTEEIEFYSRASGTLGKREDWYRLVVPDDGTSPFVEHAWAYHNADGDTEFNGSSSIPVSDFLSKEYPEDAKMSLRWLLIAKPSGSS